MNHHTAVARTALAVGLCLAVGASPARAAGGSGSLPQMSQTNSNAKGCIGGASAVAPGTPWPQAELNLEQAWQFGQGRSVTVAVLDTGVDSTGSPQLAGQVTGGPNIAGPANTDCVGHGTFSAALIAARPRPGSGFTGIAPQAHLYALAVTDQSGATTPTAIAQGIDAAVAAGAAVIDVGVATLTDSAQLAEAVGRATAAGALVVAPATLDGQSQSAPVYPAAYPGVLAVSEVGPGGVLPSSQSTGAPVGLVAPGDSVVGVGPSGSGNYLGTGPSYAAALVAGTAALVVSYRGRLSPAALIHRLEATALHPGTGLPDARRGYGSLDPYAALSTILPEEYGSAPAPASPGKARLTVAPPPSQASADAGLAAAAAGLGGTLLVLLTALTVTRGRRRGWRPGSR